MGRVVSLDAARVAPGYGECWLAPVIIPGKYGVRSRGVDYLVDIATLAHVLFGGWKA